MGVYLNPGASLFHDNRRSEIYVDKSMLIAELNRVIRTTRLAVCMSRPRRFGKTMAVNMVCSYYDRTVDGAAEFEGLKIASDPGFSEHLNKYDVIKITMQQFLSATHDVDKLIARIQKFCCAELRRAYPDCDFLDPEDLCQSMLDVFAQTQRHFVIVIDEWDCVMREMQGNEEGQRRYLDFLRAWLKDQPYVALAYMTGILPIKKYGSHSALNMFSEIGMLGAQQFAPYMGFTEDEVRELCDEKGRDFTECRAWYDGYRVMGAERAQIEAYSPNSVVEAMRSGNYMNYWNRTETFEALKRYIDMDLDGLHERVVRLISGERISVETRTYGNDMTTFNYADDVLTLLIHLGYLTYDANTGETWIPNREVMDEFSSAVRFNEGWGEVSRSISDSEGLLNAIIAGDEAKVAAGVERAHEDASSIISYNDENSLAATLRLAFFSCIRRWRLVREMPAGKGYADLVLIPLAAYPDVPGIVIELKFGASAEDALEQIRNRRYERALDGLAGNDVILCGIAYDPKTKAHACKIERH